MEINIYFNKNTIDLKMKYILDLILIGREKEGRISLSLYFHLEICLKQMSEDVRREDTALFFFLCWC